MRFSILHGTGAPGRLADYHQLMNEAREFAVAADRAGFWSIWYTEHHSVIVTGPDVGHLRGAGLDHTMSSTASRRSRSTPA
ncbi:hypothetical protein [Streptomyces sp. NPDC046862]|uniref:hypothetical protein n=1 Tax=Streptomyces sp. NPDC046862 TaxID=3154603 RepID=UPI003454E77C